MKANMKNRVFLVKEAEVDMPWLRKQPVIEQPVMQLPLPAPMSETHYQDARKKDEEKNERGVWTIDI